MKKPLALCLLILLYSFFFVPHSFAQKQGQALIDSLKQVLPKANEDSNKINLLGSLSWEYSNINPDSGSKYGNAALALAEKLEDKKKIADVYNDIGVNHEEKSDYPKALEYYFKALELNEETGNKKGQGKNLGNIGIIYYQQSDYPKALEYDFKSLKASEEIGSKRGQAITLGNIGLIYYYQSDYPKALEYYFKALKLNEETGNKIYQAGNLVYIGLVYQKQSDYPKALEYDFKALKLNEEIGNKSEQAWNLGNIGLIYSDQSDYPNALEYGFKSLKLSEEIGDKNGQAWNLGNIGLIYYYQTNYSKALEYDFKSLKLSGEMGRKYGQALNLGNIGEIYLKAGEDSAKVLLDSLFKGRERVALEEAKKFTGNAIILFQQQHDLNDLKNYYRQMSEVEKRLGDATSALDYYQKYAAAKDSVFNEENQKKLTGLQMQYDFDKKQDSINAEQVKKDDIKEHEIKNQKLIRNYTLAGLGVVLFFLVFVFVQRNKIAKEKKRSDELLLNILPAEVAEELKAKGSAEAKAFDDVTVIFTDFKGFTSISEKLTAKELVAEIDYCFKGFDNIIHKYGIEKIKTIGDSYMAVGGLPVANKTHAKDVVNAALEIVQFMEAHKQQRIKENKPVFEIRIGINTGPVVAGIVGVKKFAYDIWGDTVNLASRMESSGEPGKVNISGSTYELVKNDFTCTHRGKIQAKNKGEVDMYFVS